MAQKRINKNLVLFLTFMGIALSVSVVAIATYQNSRKDPEVYAADAKKALDATPPDRLRAIERYVKAYDARKEVKYLVAASQCAYDMGEISQAITILANANAQDPSDKSVLETVLRYMWELKDVRFSWSELRDYSAKLLKLAPDHVFGLVANSLALANLESEDPQNIQKSEQALARALELAPDDPEVAMRRAEHAVEKASRDITRASATADMAALQRKGDEARVEALGILLKAAEKNPKHTKLIIRTASQLAATKRADEGIALLKRAVEQSPDDPELRLHLGANLSAKAAQLDRTEAVKIEPEAKAQLVRSMQLEPTMYAAYSELARLAMRDVDEKADPSADAKRRGEAALKVFDDAIAGTMGLKSVKATLNALGRAAMFLDAFQTALGYYRDAQKPEDKTAALKKARSLYDQANVLYPQWHAVPYMEGQLYIAEQNLTAAIQCMEKANTRFAQGPWMPACERLALLYREVGQHGEALRYSDLVLSAYQAMHVTPPAIQVANKAQLLNIVGRPQEGLEVANDGLRAWPKDAMMLSAKADALTRLGRTKEAAGALEAVGDNDSAQLVSQKARVAALGNDFAEAERLLRDWLQKSPINQNVLQLYASVMISADRREDGRQFVASLKSKTKDASENRVLEALDALLGIPDPAQREAKLLQIIDSNPDATARAADRFNYFTQQQNSDKAAEALLELEKLLPDDPNILDRAFMLATYKKEWDKAEKYVVTLSKLNADRAKGATYRARLEMAKGQSDPAKGQSHFDAAIAAFREAELVLPVDSQLKVNLAQAMMMAPNRKLDDVYQVLTAAIEANPRNFDAHRLMFSVCGQLGKEDEASAHLVRASELNPNDSFVQERKQIIDEEKDPKSGIARREQDRKQKPDDADNLVRLGQLYWKLKDAVKAQECFDAALKAKPGDFQVVRAATSSLAGAGRTADAERVIRQFIQTASGNDKIVAHFVLASIFEKVGEQSAAFDVYREAERAAEGLSDATQKRAMQVEAAVQFAEFCSRVELSKEMIDAYRRALDKVDPASKDLAQRIRLRIIQGMFVTRRYGDVEKEIESFNKDYAGDVRGLVERARLMLARDQSDQARATYTQVLDRDPDNAFVLFMRGSVNLDLHKYPEAIADLSKAKRLRPDDFGLSHRLRLAQAYEASGDFDRAETELREMLDARPTDSNAAERLVRLYQRTRHLDRAERLAREFIVKQPQSAYWQFQLGRAFVMSQNYSAAVEPFTHAVELTRNSPAQNVEATAELMQAFVRANRAGEAISLFEAQPNKDQVSPMVRFRAGEAYLRAAKQSDAMAQFERALSDGAEQGWGPMLTLTRGVAGLIEPAKLLELLKQMAEKSPPGTAGLLRQASYAQVLATNNQGAEANKILDALLARTGDDGVIRSALLEIKAQATADAEGQARIYEQILNENPDNVAAINNLAYLLADKLNRPKEALKYAERAREMIGPDPNVLDTLGWVRFQNGDMTGAESALRESVQLDDGNIPAHYHLGRLYAKQGQRDRARQSYDKALGLAKTAHDEEHIRLVEQASSQL